MVFLCWYEHFRTRFLMHIFAYFDPFVHICILVHILENFAYFDPYFELLRCIYVRIFGDFPCIFCQALVMKTKKFLCYFNCYQN